MGSTGAVRSGYLAASEPARCRSTGILYGFDKEFVGTDPTIPRPTRTSRCARTSGCSGACSGTRCASRKASRLFELVEGIRRSALRFRRDGDLGSAGGPRVAARHARARGREPGGARVHLLLPARQHRRGPPPQAPPPRAPAWPARRPSPAASRSRSRARGPRASAARRSRPSSPARWCRRCSRRTRPRSRERAYSTARWRSRGCSRCATASP